MFQSSILISGYDALTFQDMLRNPEMTALVERDEFVSDIDIEIQPNGEIIINCDSNFEVISKHDEIYNTISVKGENLYDTIDVKVDSGSDGCVLVSQLIYGYSWSDSKPKYSYKKRYKYISNQSV